MILPNSRISINVIIRYHSKSARLGLGWQHSIPYGASIPSVSLYVLDVPLLFQLLVHDLGKQLEVAQVFGTHHPHEMWKILAACSWHWSSFTAATTAFSGVSSRMKTLALLSDHQPFMQK